MKETAGATRHGTKSLERAVRLVKLVSRRGSFGSNLTDLAAQAGIGASTAHRILGALVRERLVQRNKGDRRYYAGPLLFELGYSVPVLSGFVENCRPVLSEIARTIGAVALLSLRSAEDFVCVARAGSSPNTTLAVKVGTRQPLITSAGGIAILLALEETDAERLVRANISDLELGVGRRMTLHRKLWGRCRSEGVSTNFGGTVPGVHGLAVPLIDKTGAPFGALSVVGAAASLPQHRAAEHLLTLQTKAEVMQAKYEMGPARTPRDSSD